MKIFRQSTLFKRCTQVGYKFTFNYKKFRQLNYLKKMLSTNFKNKMPSTYTLNDKEFLSKVLELVFEELEIIISTLELNLIKINSDFEASSILIDLMVFGDFTSKISTDTIYIDTYLYRDVNCKFLNVHKVSQRYSALIGLIILVQKKNCLKYCKEEVFKRMLCDDCFKQYNINFNRNFDETENVINFIKSSNFDKYFCYDCKEKIEKYYENKNKKKFCSICLENRIIRAYSNLREYISELNLYNIFKRNNYISFLEKAISLIYYEKELLPYGDGYFPTNYT